MTTFEQFIERLNGVHNGLDRDYQLDDEKRVELCEVLHHELQLDQTPVHDADERSALLKANGVDVEPDSIKLTKEHLDLHTLLRGMHRLAVAQGLAPDEFAALLFALGRRYGLNEASGLMPAWSWD